MNLRTAKPKKARQTKALKSQNCLYKQSGFGGYVFLCQHHHRIIAMNDERKEVIIKALIEREMYENEN
jgi:hypothetical protein